MATHKSCDICGEPCVKGATLYLKSDEIPPYDPYRNNHNSNGTCEEDSSLLLDGSKDICGTCRKILEIIFKGRIETLKKLEREANKILKGVKDVG